MVKGKHATPPRGHPISPADAPIRSDEAGTEKGFGTADLPAFATTGKKIGL